MKPNYLPEKATMEAFTWKLINSYFLENGGSEGANPLVQHQIDSYNEFLDKKLYQIIQGFNPVQICHNYKESIKDFTYKIFLTFTNPSLSKPILQSQDGSQQLMTPHLARMNSLTYGVNLYVDINILIETINEDGITERQETKVPNVIIGKIPVMVRSKACVLTMMPGLAEQEGKHECRYDPGGYFIINGNEKVVISQDRISENKTLVFSNSPNDGMTAEIRSIPDGIFLPPKTTNLSLSAKPNHLGRTIRMNTSFLRTEIPVFVMFRVLGISTDSDILQHIMHTIDNPKHQRLLTELTATIEDASDIHTQEEAITFISKYMNLSGTPREYLDQPEVIRKVILQIIQSDFLPHVGPSFKRKALYLGSMILKLLHVYLGYQIPDNRDSYLYKRIDSPGVLLSNLFRQCYGKMVKEMRTAIQRELQLWRATPTIPANIINTSNIHRFCKQSIIEMGIRYALSTGNWGVKSLGSFQNIRSGVAQVLNRMSYMSTLSHLRRINTPMEKNGKLVQPRKLDNTQFGMICLAETPEGSSVGLVKNMALSTKITISMNSDYIRELIVQLGTQVYDDNVEDFRTYLHNMGQDNAVFICINGDIVGYHTDPVTFYNQMKSYKRKGHIPPTTAVSWDNPHNTIFINTEAGRMCRPLYIVDDGKQVRMQEIIDQPIQSFGKYLAKLEEDEEGYIEYMDVEEIDRAMVAMMPVDLTKQARGTWIPPKYTHMEIHPSLMMGVLACNIPFSDHNQSPRNCYQSAMGKQAVGIYMSNFNNRMDTLGHILNYPQKPLARTKLSKYMNGEKMPSGINAVVAIMTMTGYNQEDSVMVNKSALDRGLFSSTYYKSYRDQCSKNHSTGEEEFFTKPEPNTSHLKPYNYDKLGPDGFVPPNTYVTDKDILVGKVMPHKVQGQVFPRDMSMVIKTNDHGHVDMNYQGVNADGYKFGKVRLRKYRKPTVGDKVASRCAQKGTIGMVYNEEDMPFSKDGIRPDIIMNPHAIPSRMTIGQLMECIMGKACCGEGALGDATPFSGCTIEDIATVLEKHGMERYGNEILYNGRTGEQIQTEIFIGPTFYQRLKHMVADKVHSRGLNGPVVMLTRQPAEGRARNGGLRFGKRLPIKVGAHPPASPTWRGNTVKFRGTLVVKFDITCVYNKDINCYISMPVWKNIEKYDNYSVSSDGLIKNNKTNRILKYYIRNGYKSVTLSNKNIKKTHNIHNIVAEHFLLKPSLKHVVNHKNEDKLDNNIDNLEYITYRENTMYSMSSKRSKNNKDIDIINFKKIPNYSLYMICKEGNIYSNYIKRLCCTTILPNGYHKIKLKEDITGLYKDMYVHVLVAMTYLDYTPSKDTIVNHKDCIKGNNHLDNLEILTHTQNTLHYIRTKPECIFRRPVQYIDKDGTIVKFKSAREASKITGIDNSSILKSCKSEKILAGNIKWNYTYGS